MSLDLSRRRADEATGGRAPVKVLYVGGLGRSGSTLLDRMLGQIPGFFSVGEIVYIWLRGLSQNRLCGCGTPFRECPFWLDVAEEAFGGWDRVDASRMMSLADSVERHRYLPLQLYPQLWPGYRARLEEHAAVLAELYRAIHVVGGTRVIVDSSKAPSYAFVLRRTPGIDLRAVHLIRDSRGTAFSWTKRVVRPDAVDQTVYMQRYHPVRIASRYLTRNLMMELLGGLGVPTVRMRYEDLVRSPRPHVERVVNLAAEEVEPGALDFIGDGEVELGVNHTVHGNPLRMKLGRVPVRLDEEWRSSLKREYYGIVTTLTWPLLRRYGYRP